MKCCSGSPIERNPIRLLLKSKVKIENEKNEAAASSIDLHHTVSCLSSSTLTSSTTKIMSSSTTSSTAMSSDLLQSVLAVPFIRDSVEFLHHFVLFFLLPVGVVVASAVFCAVLVSRLYKVTLSRYATPEELYDEALTLLKKDCTSKQRKKALNNLRLVLKLKRHFIKAYVVLATELFYGELKHTDDSDSRYEQKYHTQNNSRSSSSSGSLRQRRNQHIQSHPAVEECQEIIEQGLSIDPTDKRLLNLQTELNLVKRYGTSSIHTQMLNFGMQHHIYS